MQPKDLFTVALIAVAAGAAAGFAGTVLKSSDDHAARSADTALAEKLDRMESRLAATLDELKESRTTLAEMKDRVTAAELAAQRRSPTSVDDDVATVPGRARTPRRAVLSADGPRVAMKLADGAQIGMPAFEFSDNDGAAVAQLVSGLSNAFKLRSLPEEKRWEKAKEDLGLSDVQIDTLKKAVAARDEAMKAAMQIDHETTSTGGATITIRTLDPAKAAESDTTYRNKVNDTLDDTQRKGWEEKGYSNAFGHGGMGGMGGGAISIVATEIHTGSEDPATKAEK